MSRVSAYAAATLTVTVTEALTINNKDYGSTQSFSKASITNVDRRVLTATTTETSIMTFSTAMAAGQSIPGKVQYLRFTNLDDTNFIVLTFANENDDEAAVKVDAGQSFVLNGDNANGMTAIFNATQDADAASDTAFGSLTNIQADANTGSCDLEVIIASA